MTLAYGMICYAMPNIDSNVSLLFLIFLFSVLDAPFSELLFCRAIEYRGKQLRLYLSGTNAQQIFGSYSMHLEI